MGAIENGIGTGAESYQVQRQRIRSRVAELTESKLQEFLECDGSVEEAVQNNADLIVEAVKALRDGGDAATFLAAFDVAVESHLRPMAERYAARQIYVERGLA